MARKDKCGRCRGRRALVQAPHRGIAWAICQPCLDAVTSLAVERAHAAEAAERG